MIKFFSISCLLTVLLLANGYAEEKKVVEAVNEYGGKTVLTSYATGDDEFKLKSKTEFFDKKGIVRKAVGFRQVNQYNKLKIDKVVEIYSTAGRLQNVELTFLPEKVRETGYDRIITHFNLNGIKSKREIYYTESDFDAKIYQKSIEYYSETGDKTRSDTYLTDSEAKKTGYYKLVSYFSEGKIIKQELYDKQGVIF